MCDTSAEATADPYQVSHSRMLRKLDDFSAKKVELIWMCIN